MDVTTVIINYQTPDLLRVAVDSFKNHYPDINLMIVDNGSTDNSKEVIGLLEEQHHDIETLFLKKNIYHGPAMHEVLKNHISSTFTFFLDSDTETKKHGFLEKMLTLASEEKVYGLGEIVTVDQRGFKSNEGTDVLHTPYMLIKSKIYLKYSPFIHHGQPTINNFREAQEHGYKLIQFPVSDYVFHHWRGTADRFGYGLGLKGKVAYLLNKLGF